MNNDLEPDWSPSGSRLLFLRTFGFPDYRILTVDRNGSDEQQVVGGFPAEQPVWSPDGTEVLYQWNGLWVVGVNGSNTHQIVFGGVVRGYSWEPVN